ncbi:MULTISPECIES: helix-turn-helix domain-containing protein [Acinetobacter]|uniref:helix-turn-helix domain-containing protein n=1 Tax=Acinetobacter TaxID=469 RepID=UPI001F292715|nr:helix-turn-helix domain-containing protein [Acinetobacter johnsonii]UJA00407.1 DNA-binding protein [Acinetobacter johnsonii]
MNVTTLLNRKTSAEIQAEIDKFNLADENASFSPETIALVLDVSMSWLQKKRCEGGGIAFSKIHYRKIIYKKSDVLAYIRSQRIHSTSQVAV